MTIKFLTHERAFADALRAGDPDTRGQIAENNVPDSGVNSHRGC